MSPEAEEAKKLGNDCAKEAKYMEALLHYSQAIKLAPKNATLYSNRSLMLLKVDQYYNGMEDALMAIKLQPNWEKGYFRLGEIQFAGEHYQDALWSYKQALQISQDDEKLKECIKTTTKKIHEQKRQDSRYPMYGTGCGLLAAFVIIVANEVLAEKSALESDLLKGLIVLALSGLGYAISLGYRYVIRSQRASLLEPPVDLFPDDSRGANNASKNEEPAPAENSRPRQRRSQASARQKMKSARS